MGMVMVAFFVFAVIAGILLALRFEVFVLVPATLFAAVVIIAVGHQPKVTIALTLLETVLLLQIGYLIGWTLRAHVANTDAAIRRFLFKVNRGTLSLESQDRMSLQACELSAD
jgi:hypothetical protein